MAHPARTTIAAMSLLLCVLSAALCVGGYAKPHGIASIHEWVDSAGSSWGIIESTVSIDHGRIYWYRMSFLRNRPRPYPCC